MIKLKGYISYYRSTALKLCPENIRIPQKFLGDFLTKRSEVTEQFSKTEKKRCFSVQAIASLYSSKDYLHNLIFLCKNISLLDLVIREEFALTWKITNLSKKI